MKILLTGSHGQLGHSIQTEFPEDWQLIAANRTQLDITNTEEINQFIIDHHPDVIINAAAYTAVDNAENERSRAYEINVNGSRNLALAAKKHEIQLILISTDYVFDGKNQWYKETDETRPINYYGQTKRDGERVSVEIWPEKTIIIRTSWVFSEYGKNFLKTIVKLASMQDTLRIVNDQFGCPTYAGDLAKSIIQLIKEQGQAGIYHYCGKESMSWFEFAERIIEMSCQKNILKKRPQLIGISTHEYKTPAARPIFSTMCCDKINRYHVEYSDLMQTLNGIISKCASF